MAYPNYIRACFIKFSKSCVTQREAGKGFTEFQGKFVGISKCVAYQHPVICLRAVIQVPKIFHSFIIAKNTGIFRMDFHAGIGIFGICLLIFMGLENIGRVNPYTFKNTL
jgi:hypothetical protein